MSRRLAVKPKLFDNYIGKVGEKTAYFDKRDIFIERETFDIERETFCIERVQDTICNPF